MCVSNVEFCVTPAPASHDPVRGLVEVLPRPLRFLGVGGLGLVPGANLGHECAIFEAVHGSAPDIAGKDIANPTALLQSAVLMLRHLDEMAAADKVQAALESVYAERKTLTRDVGGTAGTTQFADAVLAAME